MKKLDREEIVDATQTHFLLTIFTLSNNNQQEMGDLGQNIIHSRFVDNIFARPQLKAGFDNADFYIYVYFWERKEAEK